jgi:hypothetical protein
MAWGNLKVELLPLGVFSDTNPAIKVGAIILMDGVSIHTAQLTVGISELLQLQVLQAKLRFRAEAGHKVTVHVLLHGRGLCSFSRVIPPHRVIPPPTVAAPSAPVPPPAVSGPPAATLTAPPILPPWVGAGH